MEWITKNKIHLKRKIVNDNMCIKGNRRTKEYSKREAA